MVYCVLETGAAVVVTPAAVVVTPAALVVVVSPPHEASNIVISIRPSTSAATRTVLLFQRLICRSPIRFAILRTVRSSLLPEWIGNHYLTANRSVYGH
jgi:hypothetical protein